MPPIPAGPGRCALGSRGPPVAGSKVAVVRSARNEASQFLGLDLGDAGPQAPATFDTFELLDFDAF